MNLADKKHCCGCGVCSTVCPFGAIKMEYDDEYFLYPTINETLCKNCGRCEQVCPILNKEKVKISTHNLKIVHGFYSDDEKHRASASGGAATAISEYIINSGGCVFGSTYSDDYKDAYYIKVEYIKDLDKLKGSRYIETKKNDIFNEVLIELNNKRQVLFTGLPCDIGALKCFLGGDFDNLYTCELICHGPTSQKVQEKYIDELSDVYKSKVVSFSSRYNMDGIEAPYIKVEFDNGKSYAKPLWDTEYGFAFANYNRESCYCCSFKGNDRVADISLGDSWRAKEEFGDKKGVSIIYAHTKKGLEMLSYIEQTVGFIIEQLDYEDIVNDNPAIYKSIDRTDVKDKILKHIKNKTLKKAVFSSKTVKQKVKAIIKNII